MEAYAAYNGNNDETDVIKAASVLLSNKEMQAFLALPDSFEPSGLDSDLVLCAVLVEATPAGLANYSAQGKVQEAIVDKLLTDTMLMRDMLVAGGATSGGLSGAEAGVARARCAFFDRNLHSRMPLVPTPARLKLLHACNQWHSSRVSTFLTSSPCKLCPNTEGIRPSGRDLLGYYQSQCGAFCACTVASGCGECTP
jgi:hypothetical protein